MPTEFTVNNSQEFQDMIDAKDFRISKAIVESILNNLNSKKKNIHVFSVTCEEEEATFDITLEKKHFAETLEENIPNYLKHELYEKCVQIKEAVIKLNNK